MEVKHSERTARMIGLRSSFAGDIPVASYLHRSPEVHGDKFMFIASSLVRKAQ